jgi:hypothetical protein
LLRKMVALDHRAHGAVKQQNPARQQRLELTEPGLSGAAAWFDGGYGGHGISSYEKTLGQNASGGAF